MQKSIRKSAIKFVHKNNLNKKNLTATELRKIIEKYNFSVVDYWTNAKNDSETIVLLEKAQATELYRFAKGFTYSSQDNKWVFVCTDMSADDTIEVLLHEIGHIVLGHLDTEGISSNTSTQQECEAFYFSQYVQERCRNSGRINLIKVGSLILAAFLLVCSAATILRYAAIPREAVTEDGKTIVRVGGIGVDAFMQPHCYWTAGGEVFHLWLDCQHLQNSSTIYVGPREKSERTACCKTCYKKFCERYGSWTK